MAVMVLMLETVSMSLSVTVLMSVTVLILTIVFMSLLHQAHHTREVLHRGL